MADVIENTVPSSNEAGLSWRRMTICVSQLLYLITPFEIGIIARMLTHHHPMSLTIKFLLLHHIYRLRSIFPMTEKPTRPSFRKNGMHLLNTQLCGKKSKTQQASCMYLVVTITIHRGTLPKVSLRRPLRLLKPFCRILNLHRSNVNYEHVRYK
jgi:hypothetical protein